MRLSWILKFSVLGSVGAMAGAAAVLGQAPARLVTGTVLAGIVLFFVLEKFVLWRHCHESDCVAHEVPPEVGDFGILLDSGYDRGRALLLNTVSSTADLIPSLHRQVAVIAPVRQLALLLAGIGTIALLHFGT
jgi:zinc and cadmium transporter